MIKIIFYGVCIIWFPLSSYSQIFEQLTVPELIEVGGADSQTTCNPNQIKDERGYCVDISPSCSHGEIFVGGRAGGKCVLASTCGENQIQVDLGGRNGVFCRDMEIENSDSSACQEQFDPVMEPVLFRDCLNLAEASRRAEADANSLLPGAISERISSLESRCQSAAGFVFGSCNSIADVPQGAVVSGGTSVESCNTLKSNAEATVITVNNQINTCLSKRSEVQTSCPSITGEVTVVGTATVGGQTARVDKVGSESIQSNTSIKERVNSILNSLEQEAAAANSELASISNQAQQCIAALEVNPADENYDYGDPTTTQDDPYSSGPTPEGNDTDSPGTGEIATGGDSEKSDIGGIIGKTAGTLAALAPAFMKSGSGEDIDPYTSYSNSTLDNYNDDETRNDYNAGTGNSQTYGQNNSSFASQRDPFIPTDDSRKPENPDQGTLAGAGGAGGAGIGVGAGGFGGGGGSQAQANDQGDRSGRRRALKPRNVFQGYKNSKRAKGGSSGNNANKRSPQYMKQAYQNAIKQFGRKTPLKFNGSKYVPDLKAMKASLDFKKRNARAVAMYEGKKASLGDVNYNDVLLQGGINPNANHGMFKTMNIYFKRNFQKASHANGLKL